MNYQRFKNLETCEIVLVTATAGSRHLNYFLPGYLSAVYLECMDFDRSVLEVVCQSPRQGARCQARVGPIRSSLMSTLINGTSEIIDQIGPCELSYFRREIVFHDQIPGLSRAVIDDQLNFVPTVFEYYILLDL